MQSVWASCGIQGEKSFVSHCKGDLFPTCVYILSCVLAVPWSLGQEYAALRKHRVGILALLFDKGSLEQKLDLLSLGVLFARSEDHKTTHVIG